MTEIGDYTDHAIQYYREHTGRLIFHLALSFLSAGGWLLFWLGWLLGSMIVGDWKEEDEE